jgi:hypothetical protein
MMVDAARAKAEAELAASRARKFTAALAQHRAGRTDGAELLAARRAYEGAGGPQGTGLLFAHYLAHVASTGNLP